MARAGQASMRPAQLTPENKIDQPLGSLGAGASMRPAQLTPENRFPADAEFRSRSRFNEAGAINAGKLSAALAKEIKEQGFNEAGAINAGKHSIRPTGRRSR